MRLIDADVLIENLTDEITNLRLNGLKGTPRQTSDLYDFIDRIKEQPTAYNVDAVVEQLEEAKSEDVRMAYCQSQNYEDSCGNRDCFECYVGHLVEIAKAGGKV